MQKSITSIPKRGGKRTGAGRPSGSGKYGTTTKLLRIPTNMEHEILGFLDANAFQLPFFSGRVQAGYPALIEREESPETINISARLVNNPGHTFVVTASGDSMINAGIYDGDLLIVDGKVSTEIGDIVVASINGEFTVKRLDNFEGKLCFLPENNNYKPIWVNETDDVQIFGVVLHSIHKLK